MAKNEVDYASLSTQLDGVLAKLQQPDISVDDAVVLYGQGLELVEQIEKYLKTAENTLKKLNLKNVVGEA